MGRDEQKEEREVLESIFPNEITGNALTSIFECIRSWTNDYSDSDVSETEWRISVKLELPESAGVVGGVQDFDAFDGQPSLLLRISLPHAYPDFAPDLDISLPPDAPRIPFLDLANDKPSLLSSLAPTIEENLGIQMIFTLLTMLKDSIETLISDRVQAGEMAREQEALKVEAEENRKFEGERVTRERFLEWRENFRAEMQEKVEKKRMDEKLEMMKRIGAKALKDEERKMTGKELWIKGIAKGDEEDVEATLEGLEVTTIT